MGVSKNRGTPKWMVKIMKNLINMDDLGGFSPYFWFNTQNENKNPKQPKLSEMLTWGIRNWKKTRQKKNQGRNFTVPPPQETNMIYLLGQWLTF